MTNVRSNFPTTQQWRARITDATVAGLNAAAVSMQKTQRDVMPRSGAPSAPGTPPRRDTGELVRSITVTQATRARLVSRSGSSTPHGYYMQHGVTSSGKWLTVPLHRPAAILRKQVSSLLAANLVMGRSQRGALLLGKATGRGKARGFEPWFVLKRSIAPRPWNTFAERAGKGRAIAEGRAAFGASMRAFATAAAGRAR